MPELDTYAPKLWDYWERNLDPDLFIDRTLKGQVEGKRILITGGTSGIGQATALKIAEAGSAKAVIVCGRDQEKIDETLKLAKKRGVKIVAYSADVSDEVGLRRVREEAARKSWRRRHPGQQRGPLNPPRPGAQLRPLP